MQFTNTEERYGAVTKFFHWTIALLILCLLAVGLYMTHADKSTAIFKYYDLHKSTGIIVGLLACCRVLWHFYSHTPQFERTVKPWERNLAHLTHYLLYFAMLAMPLSGWFFSSARRGPVHVFGLFDAPQPFDMQDPKIKAYAEWAENFHDVMAYILIGIICLHVAGALKHFIIDRDKTLQRMLPFGTVDEPIQYRKKRK